MDCDTKNREICSRLADHFKNNPEVRLLFLFGSAAHGKMSAASDIDIAVLFAHSPDAFAINQLSGELNKLLKKDIDIAVLNSASPILKMQVLKNGVLIAAKDKKYYHKFYMDTVNQYDDLKQTRKICEDNILKGRIYAR